MSLPPSFLIVASILIVVIATWKGFTSCFFMYFNSILGIMPIDDLIFDPF